MSRFLTRLSTVALLCLSMPSLFCADEIAVTDEPANLKVGAGLSVGEIVTAIANAAPAPLTIQKCVLDFSTPNAIAASSGRITLYLLGEKTNNTLDLIDVTYLTFEGFAAGVRQNPEKFGRLDQYFTNSNKDVVYDTFLQIAGSIEVAQRDLNVLENLETCTALVQKTITTDLPILLTRIGVPAENQADISLLATVFTPMFAQLLNKTYVGAVAAATAFNSTDTEEEIVSSCGCFGRSSTRTKKK